MKKVFFIVCIALGMIFTVFHIENIYNKDYKIDIKATGKESSIILKGLKDSKDFAWDDMGGFYIAFSNRIQYVDNNGLSYDIINDNNLNIYSIEYYMNNIYYSSNNGIYLYNIKQKSTEKLIDNIPNYGDYKDVKIKIKNHMLYASIGSATNSGVVGKDNLWLGNNPFIYDMSPQSITLKGKNFGVNKTGAFTPYNTSNIKGQIVSGHFPGNSSIIIYNLKTKAAETYAYGIRNIKGMDFNSQGKLVATVGGMENRGLRPIIGDSDYIFYIEQGKWYGFPDYSGGDPIDSPRFSGKGNQKVNFILDKHPTTNPSAPIYQSKWVSSLTDVAVDKTGAIGMKDSIYFYDTKENSIYFFNKDSAGKVFTSFKNKANIVSMKFYDNKLTLLDSEDGILVSIANNSGIDKKFPVNNIMIYVLFFGVTICIVFILVFEKIK